MLDCFHPAPTYGMITSSTMTTKSGDIAFAIWERMTLLGSSFQLPRY